MPTIPEAIHTIKQQINTAAHQFQRSPTEIQLLAVSKTRPVEDIIIAMQCGQQRFGESYVQEALSKMNALNRVQASINLVPEWHFIGPLQSNKTRAIAENFAWVHSLDDLRHAQRLSQQRPEPLPPLNLCIQVNVSAEPQKSGIELTELLDFAKEVVQLPHLRLRGLMTIPAYIQDFEEQRRPFQKLYAAYRQLQNLGLALDTLSMGMTDDMVAAIAEGSTLVRIGTAIFGARK